MKLVIETDWKTGDHERYPEVEVIDRRKIKAKKSRKASSMPTPPAETPSAPAASGGGPRLVVNELKPAAAAPPEAASPTEGEMPAPPTAEESREQKAAYDASAQRLEDLVRRRTPRGRAAAHQLRTPGAAVYVSAMIQMGAGAQEGQRPKIDILGARTTIDLLGVLAEKTRGNLTRPKTRRCKRCCSRCVWLFLN